MVVKKSPQDNILRTLKVAKAAGAADGATAVVLVARGESSGARSPRGENQLLPRRAWHPSGASQIK